MAVFRIIKDKDAKECADDLIREEIFEEDEFPSEEIKDDVNIAKKSMFLSVFFAVFLLAIGGYSIYEFKFADSGEDPYVFFEVRAIDGQGHPVSGASIHLGKETLGLTDSYGEWRRFMRAKLGSTISFDVYKKMRGSKYTASRVFDVPSKAPIEGEIELIGTVQLVPESEKLEISLSDKSEDEVVETPKEKWVSLEQLDKELPKKDSEKIDAALLSKVKVVASKLNTVWFRFDRSNMKYMNAQDLKAAKFLEQEVLASLKTRSKELGLVLDSKSPWNVSIRHLVASAKEKNKGLMEVVVAMPGSDKKVRFLKNYKPGSMGTARSILWGLKLHTAKAYYVFEHEGQWYVSQDAQKQGLWSLKPGEILINYDAEKLRVSAPVGKTIEEARLFSLGSGNKLPCEINKKQCYIFSTHVGIEKPAKGWKRYDMIVFGSTRGRDLYVGGYKAEYKGGKRWKYWGETTGKSNLTVVSNGRVIYRKKIANSTSHPAMISLPKSSLTRK